VDDRGSFYDPVGALREVAQNHQLQFIEPFASETPTLGAADELRGKRMKVFRAIPPAHSDHYVRGQYDGYLAVPGVSPGPQTETFAALRLEIRRSASSPRWTRPSPRRCSRTSTPAATASPTPTRMAVLVGRKCRYQRLVDWVVEDEFWVVPASVTLACIERPRAKRPLPFSRRTRPDPSNAAPGLTESSAGGVRPRRRCARGHAEKLKLHEDSRKAHRLRPPARIP
jgi:hypothetical protein